MYSYTYDIPLDLLLWSAPIFFEAHWSLVRQCPGHWKSAAAVFAEKDSRRRAVAAIYLCWLMWHGSRVGGHILVDDYSWMFKTSERGLLNSCSMIVVIVDKKVTQSLYLGDYFII